jgi:hypothetical protein
MLLILVFTAAFGLGTLDLQPNERTPIIAPHPDDEVLVRGGLIQQALALGNLVWVVYMTAPCETRPRRASFPEQGGGLLFALLLLGQPLAQFVQLLPQFRHVFAE